MNSMKYIYTIVALLLCCIIPTMSQSIYNGETITIGTNAQVYVPDSVINNGVIINNGNISVGGIWQNNATYQPGTGQLTLSSNLPQVINHNDQSFTRLSIEGGGIKTFGANIHIVNELVLNNGVMQSANNAYIVIEQGASIVGGSDNAYVDGKLYRAGSGLQEYPVGTSGMYLPVTLTDIKGNNPVVGVSAGSPNPNLEVAGGLMAVSSDHYWEIDVLSGGYDGSPVILPVRNELFLNSIQQAVVASTQAMDQPFQSRGAVATTGDIQIGSVTSAIDIARAFVTVGSAEQIANNELVIYNAVSPNNDGLNDILKIVSIENFPNNVVTVYTRWGDKVFEMEGYDNLQNVFMGYANVKRNYKLPEGDYYYVVEKGDGSKRISGFFVLKY